MNLLNIESVICLEKSVKIAANYRQIRTYASHPHVDQLPSLSSKDKLMRQILTHCIEMTYQNLDIMKL